MKSISTHLTKRIIGAIIIIYSLFLVFYFSIHFVQVYKDTKKDLTEEVEVKIDIIDNSLKQFFYFDTQIVNTLQEKSTFNSFVGLNLNNSQTYVLKNMMENNYLYDNLSIIDQTCTYIFQYKAEKYDCEYLKQTTNNPPALTSRLIEDETRLFVVSRYNNYYLIYSYNDDVLKELYRNKYQDVNYYIQTPNNDILLSNYQSLKNIEWISSDKDEGFLPFFSSNTITYYKKVNFLETEYTVVSKIPLKAIVGDIVKNAILGFLVSFLILFISILLNKRKITNALKKPLKQFISEIKDFSESDYVYFTTIKEPHSVFIELSTILTQYKKIFLYNKNTYENIIQELQKKLQLAEENIKSKSLFLANMSHEMRTPLNSIIGYSQLTKKIGFENKEKVAEYFDCINDSSEILLQKINDILDLSKIESNQFELNFSPTELKNLIKEIYHILKIQADKKEINFTYSVNAHIPKLLDVDKTRLKQIIINLCSNAIKFTDRGYVKLEVELFGYTNDNSVVIEYKISDTGCGIPKDKIDNIFIPFVQVKNCNYIGTGLGLAIARDLIRLMGGDINVVSKENVGSIFSFNTIFRVSSDEKILTTNVGIDNELLIKKLQNKKILIVEDNVINQVFMKELFTIFKKVDIEIASDGLAAVKKCHEKQFDLILMDIQMPKMSGIEATRQIRLLEKNQNVAIIALTANAFSEQIHEYLDVGMTDYLPKPVDINHFKSVLISNL